MLGERLDDYVREIHDALGAVCLRRTPLEPTTDLDNLFVDPDYESL